MHRFYNIGGRRWVYDVSDKADIHRTAEIGNHPESRSFFDAPHGVVIGPTARLGPFTIVDAGTEQATHVHGWLLAGAHVGHDARVEEGAEISAGVQIGGHAYVGYKARVGMNATVLPYKRVGDGAVIGAGAVVTRDVPAGEVWAGVPARYMRDTDGTVSARPIEDTDARMWETHPYTNPDTVWEQMARAVTATENEFYGP